MKNPVCHFNEEIMKKTILALFLTLLATQAFASGGDGQTCYSKNPNAASEKDAYAEYEGQLVLSISHEGGEGKQGIWASLEVKGAKGKDESNYIASFGKVTYRHEKSSGLEHFSGKDRGKILDVRAEAKSGDGVMRYTDVDGKIKSVEVRCYQD